MNKVIGLGFDGALDFDCLTTIEEQWRQRAEPVRIELSILADATIPPALTERGYCLHGFENVLARTVEAPGALQYPPNISVEILNEKDARTWIDIAVTAFLNLDGTGSVADDALSRESLERELGDLGGPRFRRYLARFDGQPVGEATLNIEDGLAQIAGAGTLPAFRGRGVQKALLARRLADAHAAGCDLAVVTTAPGTRSQDNVMRRGFALLYTRAILLRRWTSV